MLCHCAFAPPIISLSLLSVPLGTAIDLSIFPSLSVCASRSLSLTFSPFLFLSFFLSFLTCTRVFVSMFLSHFPLSSPSKCLVITSGAIVRALVRLGCTGVVDAPGKLSVCPLLCSRRPEHDSRESGSIQSAVKHAQHQFAGSQVAREMRGRESEHDLASRGILYAGTITDVSYHACDGCALFSMLCVWGCLHVGACALWVCCHRGLGLLVLRCVVATCVHMLYVCVVTEGWVCW